MVNGTPGREQDAASRGSKAMIAATSGKPLADGMADIRALSAANNRGIITLLKSTCVVGAWVSAGGSVAC